MSDYDVECGGCGQILWVEELPDPGFMKLCNDCEGDMIQKMTCTYTDKIRNHKWKTIYMYEGKYTQQPGHRLMCTSCQEVVRERHQEEQQPT